MFPLFIHCVMGVNFLLWRLNNIPLYGWIIFSYPFLRKDWDFTLLVIIKSVMKYIVLKYFLKISFLSIFGHIPIECWHIGLLLIIDEITVPGYSSYNRVYAPTNSAGLILCTSLPRFKFLMEPSFVFDLDTTLLLAFSRAQRSTIWVFHNDYPMAYLPINISLLNSVGHNIFINNYWEIVTDLPLSYFI